MDAIRLTRLKESDLKLAILCWRTTWGKGRLEWLKKSLQTDGLLQWKPHQGMNLIEVTPILSPQS